MIILGVNELLSKQSIIVTVSISLDDLVLGILILILTLPLPKHKQCTRIARFEQYNILICEICLLFEQYYTITALERDQYEVLWSTTILNEAKNS